MTSRRRQRNQIIKADGRIEKFSRKKLYRSLSHSGLSKKHCDDISHKVASEVKNGCPTKEIFRRTLSLVNKSSPIAGAQYSLKKALFELGPGGHHFETYVSYYFRELGFSTQTCVNVPGRLVNHEVDVRGHNKNQHIFVECKFHNRAGIKNDIKVALYVKARWDDISQGPEGKNITGFYLASNTSFTKDAITYSKGSGLKLLGVNAPEGKSFFDQIHELGLYPITSLRKLTKLHKSLLLEEGIILARDLLSKNSIFYKFNFGPDQIEALLQEVQILLKGKNK
jgi:hypothetical protein